MGTWAQSLLPKPRYIDGIGYAFRTGISSNSILQSFSSNPSEVTPTDFIQVPYPLLTPPRLAGQNEIAIGPKKHQGPPLRTV